MHVTSGCQCYVCMVVRWLKRHGRQHVLWSHSYNMDGGPWKTPIRSLIDAWRQLIARSYRHYTLLHLHCMPDGNTASAPGTMPTGPVHSRTYTSFCNDSCLTALNTWQKKNSSLRSRLPYRNYYANIRTDRNSQDSA